MDATPHSPFFLANRAVSRTLTMAAYDVNTPIEPTSGVYEQLGRRKGKFLKAIEKEVLTKL